MRERQWWRVYGIEGGGDDWLPIDEGEREVDNEGGGSGESRQ